MADNIEVAPSIEANRVAVATDEVEGVHVPIYKTAIGKDGEMQLVTHDRPLPMDSTEMSCLLADILSELRILNLYNAMTHNQELTKEDLEE